MKHIIMALMLSILFLGCSSNATEDKSINPALVVGKTFQKLTLNDQFEKSHSLRPDTYKVIFAFSKDAAHTCNNFFKTQTATYLQDNHTEFVADVSAAPSLIRSFFILPGLKEFKHTVLLLEDKEFAASYRKGVDTEKIAVVYLLNHKIEKIDFITTPEELQKIVEEKSPMSIVAPLINQILN